ncbi:hypothetical protein LEP1GSC202_0063 [Leptospira yanagawae serovar Saopaulo str. Sao Paulo = ATCC 700523]|uniref:Uncharacterized protein n=1 Tax=Leptospira yanagawae serovar Saopaulo str. Sao Paulo = ATCC 700523 TaxID=1249483 RepID=A0A5E8H759_9LEPT|nr:hypothetical protein [Leptospira yanagawae]EOQ86994.1 hypothetical protein LEP1GSC202_0063 [Leptospira yanagawae serovar Saopaulo str. Sao Paulo = ATCC 700523]
MRISPPHDHFLQLTTKENLGRSSGIILQKEALSIMKTVEAQSSRENIEAGHLFRPTDANFEKLKMDRETAFDQMWELIDYGLATQLFEIKYDADIGELRLVTFLVGLPSGMPLEEPYKLLIGRSTEHIYQFIQNKRTLTEDTWRNVLNQLADIDYKEDGPGDELDRLLDPKQFPLQPSSEMLKRSRGLIIDELAAEAKVIVLPHIGFYYLPESEAAHFLNIANEYLMTKVEPFAKAFDSEIRLALDRLFSPGTGDVEINEIEIIRAKVDTLYSFKETLKEHGFYSFIHNLKKVTEIAVKFAEVEKRKEVDRLLKVYMKMLDSQFDFDSRLLRINLEKDDEHNLVIVDLLRKNPKVLSAEWHDADSKIAVFVNNNQNNIKEINSLIYQNYRFTTEHILYLKAILELNEKELKPIFKDEEFVKTYGKNLQAVYFNYIPWFYKLFYFLGITPIVNSGYAKAKSILTFLQMDRQFLYQKRRENFFKKKLREREERLEKEKKQQLKKALVSALSDAYFKKNCLPSVDWLGMNYPAFSAEKLEKMIPDFAFLSTTGKSIKPHSVILFPNSPEFESFNKDLKDLLNQWIRGEVDPPKEDPELFVQIRNLL